MPIFTTSIFLLSGLAVIVPIALHLLHRRKPQPMLFGAVRFLRAAVSRSRRSRRITQGLTLLMRCLILLLLAFAFARPLIRQSSFLPEGSRRVLLVLDASGSMQAKVGEDSVFAKGQEWMLDVLEDLAEGDAVGLLILSESGSVKVIPPVTDREHVRGLIGEARCGDGWVDLPEGIFQGLKNDEGAFRDFELHVFSDFQHGSWQEASVTRLSELLAERHCAVFLNVPSGGKVSDAGLAGLRFSPTAIMGAGPYGCTYTLTHTEDYAGSLTIRLIGEDREQDQMTAVLPGAELSDTLTGQAEAGKPGVALTGKVVIDTDSYALNDCRYYSLARLSGRPALVINGSGDARDSFFLTRALKPTGAVFAYMEPVVKDWAGLMNSSDLSAYAMIFLCNPPAMDQAALAHLKGYVEAGGMLVIFPGGLKGLTQETLRALTGQADLTVREEVREEPAAMDIAAQSQTEDRLSARLHKMLPPPWKVTVNRRLVFPAGDKESSFAHYVSGGEFMLRRPLGNGELFVCSLSANRDWADLPLTPFYFVLVQEMSRYGAGFRHRELSVAVGGEWSLPVQGTLKEGGPLKGRDGAGHQVELQGVVDSSGKTLVVSGFHQVGIYAVELPWGETRQVAVNLPSGEQSLVSWGREEMSERWFRGLPVAVCSSHGELRHELSGVSRSHPLAPWLLLGAFILSMVEVLYANLRSRKPRQPKLVEGLLKHGGGVA